MSGRIPFESRGRFACRTRPECPRRSQLRCGVTPPGPGPVVHWVSDGRGFADFLGDSRIPDDGAGQTLRSPRAGIEEDGRSESARRILRETRGADPASIRRSGRKGVRRGGQVGSPVLRISGLQRRRRAESVAARTHDCCRPSGRQSRSQGAGRTNNVDCEAEFRRLRAESRSGPAGEADGIIGTAPWAVGSATCHETGSERPLPSCCSGRAWDARRSRGSQPGKSYGSASSMTAAISSKGTAPRTVWSPMMNVGVDSISSASPSIFARSTR